MAPSRGSRCLIRAHQALRFSGESQHRTFATASIYGSGHNRWSKIKHDKGKADAAMNKQRSAFAHEIATASKLFGPELSGNPRLADLVTKAKKAGFLKASIEAAIARGQGRSTTGASLENVTVEGLLPHNIAVIVECETDRKLRALAEVRTVIKDSDGSSTPTSYLFSKKGRVVLEEKDGIGMEQVLEPALEAGALDVNEDADGRIVVHTEPGETRAVGDAISQALEVQIATSEIIWDPNEDTMVTLPDESAVDEICKFIDNLRDRDTSVQSIALNVKQGSVGNDAWENLQSRL
ncbi:YebC-like protein [Dissoconium aciculare CBS 342.82]|uniref:YebC-like protein n=1 Tax=Dissoconium aciculare CBS 342.82 TaxID=1314786 RepID=A0A6J3MHF5_9PEZI|nr:YebC-like protein [Dissoconium aciculare CBS 342.82]KAF1827313.1 YebC-like protein [Dissoconium aciculare CBS 342.82]